MRRKLSEYFNAGARPVWYIDAKARTAPLYTSPSRSALIDENGVLEGRDVLPGFALLLRELFAETERRGPRRG
jgi:hypothetical protein